MSQTEENNPIINSPSTSDHEHTMTGAAYNNENNLF